MADISQIEVNGTTYDICDATARDSLSQYLPLTGGTLSNNLCIKSNDIDRDGANPSEYQRSKTLTFWDKDDEVIGQFRVDHDTDGDILTRIVATNEKSDGTQVYNVLNLHVDKNGNRKVTVTDQEAWREGIGAISSTLEDEHILYNRTNFDLKRSNNGVSSEIWPAFGYMQDKNGLRSSFVGNTISPNGNVATSLYAYNYDSNGTRLQAGVFSVGVKKDGSIFYGYTDQGAARAAIGMGENAIGTINHGSSNTTFLRNDGTWARPGKMSVTGTPSPTSNFTTDSYTCYDSCGAKFIAWNVKNKVALTAGTAYTLGTLPVSGSVGFAGTSFNSVTTISAGGEVKYISDDNRSANSILYIRGVII